MRRILLFLSLATLVSWGCHKKSSVSIPTTPPAAAVETAPEAVTPELPAHTPPIPESTQIAKTITAPTNLELCDLNFRTGNYPQAAKACAAFLSNNPKSPDRDRAFFQLGLSLALPRDNNRDLRQAETALRRLVIEYPNSPYKNPADYILSLWGQIDKLRSDVKDMDERTKKLNDELQVLKEIDLQRRPSRPKE